jgi:hypothetical protein
MIVTGSSLPRKSVMALPVIEIWPTRKCMVIDCAERWSQMRRCIGSIASAFTVRMPWMVSTSIAWRWPSAEYSFVAGGAGRSAPWPSPRRRSGREGQHDHRQLDE